MLHLPGTTRTFVILLGATANQLALSIPCPELDPIEATVAEARELHKATYRQKWLWYGIPSWKAVVLCSTVLDLASAYKLLGPSCSELHTRYLASIANEIPTSAAVGLSMLTIAATVQVASRLALSRNARFPILPISLTTHLPLHVPPSIAEALFRSQKNQQEHSLDVASGQPQHSLRSEHDLITSGPYGYVRHPMFSAFILGGLGSSLFYTSGTSPLNVLADAFKLLFSHLPYQLPRSIILSSNINISWNNVGLGALLIGFGAASLHLYRTACMEDEALQVRFGGQWRVYRWHVKRIFW